jgi:sialidase-1
MGEHRVYVMRSDDDGITFKGMDGSSNPTDMTETLTPKTHADGGVWAWDAVGPGAGLYTSDGIIIIPVQFRNIYYSTDHGETWQVQRFPESTGEATIDDGSLYRNDRPNTTNWSAAQRRCISRGSLDGGFSAYEPDDKLLDPMNQASVLLYNNAEPDAPTRMIFLNSASTVTRTKMRFRISYDNAKTWPMSRPLSDLPLPPGSGTESSYSSMVKTADNRVGAMWKPTWTSRIMMYLLLGFYGIGKVNLGWLLRGCAC